LQSRPVVEEKANEENLHCGDFVFFGSETKGLGREFIAERIDRSYRIPIFEPGVRSLNLSNAVSIVVYEALRQIGLL
jgi:tRNA (cytidine/uridine-2'-O-)-methyltransferase